jgi:transcriptional regulator with XRE-family HTH domain
MDYSLFRRRLGNRIRIIRRKKGIKQEKLAELVDKTTEHISYLERGERSPSFELLLDLSHALDVSLSHLMNIRLGEEEPMDETVGMLPAPIPTVPVLHEVDEPIKPEDQLYPAKPVLDRIFEPRVRSRSKKVPDRQSPSPSLE